VEFRLLGPLEIVDEDQLVDVGRGRQRALVALLLVRANEVVPVDGLIEALWNGEEPPSARQIVQNYVLRLRRALGTQRVKTNSGGYALMARADEIDSRRAEALLATGREALRSDHLEEAERLFAQALQLWRGEPLAEFAYDDFAAREIARLRALRLDVIEEHCESAMALGRHRELIADLEQLVAANPLRERLRGQLMLALYRAGRQSDALDTYRAGRSAMVDEKGLEPSEELQRLERAILNHDPVLGHSDSPSPTRVHARSRRSQVIWIGAATVATCAAVLAVILTRSTSGGGTPLTRLTAGSVARVDPRTGKATAIYQTGGTPELLAVLDHATWVASYQDTIERIAVPSGARTAYGTRATPTDLTVGDGSVWAISSFDGEVVRFDPSSASPVAVIRAGAGLSSISVGGGSVWVTNQQAGTLKRIDVRTEKVLATLRGLASPLGLTIGHGEVWVAESAARRIDGVDVATSRIVHRIPLPLAPGQLAYGAGSIWATDPANDAVLRIDPSTFDSQLISVGRHPEAIAANDDEAWVLNDLDHSVFAIDAKTGSIVKRLILSQPGTKDANPITPGGIAVAGSALWISVQGY
jgi:DNA-binding SARP family transcriptional activator